MNLELWMEDKVLIQIVVYYIIIIVVVIIITTIIIVIVVIIMQVYIIICCCLHFFPCWLYAVVLVIYYYLGQIAKAMSVCQESAACPESVLHRIQAVNESIEKAARASMSYVQVGGSNLLASEFCSLPSDTINKFNIFWSA